MVTELPHAWARHGLFGGHLALDFLNTIDDEGKTRNRDALPDWTAVRTWAVLAGVWTEAEARDAAGDACATASECAALHALKETAWGVLSALAADRPADPAALSALAAALADARVHSRLEQDGRVLRWTADAAAPGPAVVRLRLALALDTLLTASDLTRLKECARCTGLYLDHGRGRGRRWCRMSTCGNRAKVARFRGKDTPAECGDG